ncbi:MULTISPECIES: M56 family metallopeptidase [Bacillus cereus group]|uniref:M56 family metallopeptidase n=1 Tax=Bacillus cereus group TaxID=86661 RepID=UPI000872FE18|nr:MULTISPECIES: M56 family metallopeptidase [Bacillus cereus group]OFD10573.1 regulatory protein BlaR1 [Bacillus thuringiensis]MBF7150517.1 transcriptional regulator [Bacillus toyonensis]MBJ8050212.1 transcriptional regulator [Bacillus cereus group sp. N18]MEC2346957.1 M56 family metallopeptidase [Bacillus toyonensis]MED3190030.1 M56 family metallopeptidase [Bacillus toyonensis]
MIDMFVKVCLPRFFDWVIETSIMASILVGLILCVKILLRNKLTPRWQYLLWMILIVRLLLPWSPDSSYSIYSILSYSNGTPVIFHQDPVTVSPTKELMQGSADIGDTKVITNEDTYTSSPTQKAEESKKQTHNNEKQDDETFSFYTILLYIWLTVVIILSFTTIIMNRRLLLYIKKQPVITEQRIVKIFKNCKQSMSVQQDIPLLLAGKISSPTVFGFIRPKVLLSSVHMKVLDEQQLRYIFHHELAHIKRRDVGVNWLIHGLLILNWFNPILWYAYSCMREDQELACDAFALTFIDSEEQIAYGHTIISLLEHYSSYYQVPGLANLSRNKRTLKRRILMIKKFKKNSYRWSAFGVVAFIAVSSFSLLNARADEPNKHQKEQTLEKIKTKETQKEEDVAIHTVVEKIIGTKEQAHAELKISEEQYKEMIDKIAAAKKFLTKKEFDTLVKLQEDWFTLEKKEIALGGMLNEEEQNKLETNGNSQGPLWIKVRKHFPSTIEDAKKLVDFPIKKPNYMPEGYHLVKEQVDSDITIEKPKPVVRTEYVDGDDGQIIIEQSEVLEAKKDPWNRKGFHMFEEYELQFVQGMEMLGGNQVTFGKSSDSNIIGMKMIVPAKDGKSAYQIVITVSILNKAELEKVMLSMLK